MDIDDAGDGRVQPRHTTDHRLFGGNTSGIERDKFELLACARALISSSFGVWALSAATISLPHILWGS